LNAVSTHLRRFARFADGEDPPSTWLDAIQFAPLADDPEEPSRTVERASLLKKLEVEAALSEDA